jgi:hypothetical protein
MDDLPWRTSMREPAAATPQLILGEEARPRRIGV